jgi:hypothetical protein
MNLITLFLMKLHPHVELAHEKIVVTMLFCRLSAYKRKYGY